MYLLLEIVIAKVQQCHQLVFLV